MRELEAEIHKMSMNGEKELMALKIELERLRIRYVCPFAIYLFSTPDRDLLPPQETRNKRSSQDWTGKDDGEYHRSFAGDPAGQGTYRRQDTGSEEVRVKYTIASGSYPNKLYDLVASILYHFVFSLSSARRQIRPLTYTYSYHPGYTPFTA